MVLGQRPHQRRICAASLRAEARDEESANNLRDVVRGFLALGEAAGRVPSPRLQPMMQSLELGGTGKTVALSFTVPAEIFDVVGASRRTSGFPKNH